MTVIDCCDGCTLRRTGCHATCPEYNKKRLLRQEEREAALKKSKQKIDADAVQWNGMEVSQRRNNRRKK